MDGSTGGIFNGQNTAGLQALESAEESSGGKILVGLNRSSLTPDKQGCPSCCLRPRNDRLDPSRDGSAE